MRLTKSTQLAIWIIAISLAAPQLIRLDRFLADRLVEQIDFHNQRKEAFTLAQVSHQLAGEEALRSFAQRLDGEAKRAEYLYLKAKDDARVALICSDEAFLNRVAKQNHKLLLQSFRERSAWDYVWLSPDSDLSGHAGYPFHLKKVLKPPTLQSARSRITRKHCFDAVSYGAWPLGDSLFDIQDWRRRALMSDAELMKLGAEGLANWSVTVEVQPEELAGEPFSDNDLKEWVREPNLLLVDKCEVVKCK
jgi:hypothetical protein